MATCLAMLPDLRYLRFGFESPQSRPDRIGIPPPTRAVLPALIKFQFRGVSEYLEDLVARIDTPKLDWLSIQLFMDLMFNIPQLDQFIVRAEEIRSFNSARILFSPSATSITLRSILCDVTLDIICSELDRQASSMTRVCSQLSLLSHVEQLHISRVTPEQGWQGNGIDSTQFLELLHPFPTLQHLHIYGELSLLVVRVLQEVTGDSAIEVLPSLRSLVFQGRSLSGSMQRDIQGFITARQNSNHPVEVQWKESDYP
ncbi:hypothetical protein BJV74DRAFT_990710 [Russula compacta]|nr:hypothetical protein BJV74DRAFT_990710 [Russula compacta]